MKRGNETSGEELIQLDLYKILESRVPESKWRLIPRGLIKWLERLIHQEELNAVLREAYPSRGWRFSKAALDFFNISLEIEGEENLPNAGRWVFAGNHPLGGLDGIALIRVLGERYGDENIRFLVNDMLMNVKPLDGVFLPVNKYGSQARSAARGVDNAYNSDVQIAVFPAGLVSRLGDDGKIRDLKWQKAFVAKAIASGRGVIPVFFEGLNSRRFYRIARWRKKLGIGVNLEQILLPGELCRSRNHHFRIIFGSPISHEALTDSGKSATELAEEIKSKVYSLAES